MWQSLLFSQLITNNLWSRCGINHLRYFVTLRMQPFLLAPHCRDLVSRNDGYYFVYPHTISVIKYKFQRAPIEGGRPPGRQESPSQAHIGVLNRPHHGFGRGNPSDNCCCFLQLIGFPDLKACQFCAYTTRGSAFSYDKRCGLGERIHWFQKYWFGLVWTGSKGAFDWALRNYKNKQKLATDLLYRLRNFKLILII